MLISIIIPVYNTERYLERCVRSVMQQTYKNLEIILVDDGSSDRSGILCDELAKTDSRTTVYHKENGGLSAARNYGIERASGAYIAFIDSDDYVAADYVAYLYQLITTYAAEISCCCFTETACDAAAFGVNSNLPVTQVLTGKEACKRLFGDLYMVLVVPWGKLYKSSIVKKHLFPVGRTCEDEATTCKYYYESGKVAVGNRRLYAYYQNPKSITHTQGDAKNEDAIWALEHRALFFEGRKEREPAKAAWRTLFAYYVKDSLAHNGRCDEELSIFSKGKTLSLHTRIRLAIYNFSPRFYVQIEDAKARLRGIRERIKQH